MIKMILFDFYGVFMPDPYDKWLSYHGLDRQGRYAELATNLDRGKISKKDFFQMLSKETGRTVESFTIDSMTPSVDGDVVSLARELSRHYSLGLLSNASPDLRAKLVTLKLAPLFGHIFISSELKLSKPQPEIFQTVLSEVALRPDQIIFVDDRQINVVAAQQVGIPSLEYTTCDILRSQLSSAGVKINESSK